MDERYVAWVGRDTIPSSKCDLPLDGGVSKCAQHLRDSTQGPKRTPTAPKKFLNNSRALPNKIVKNQASTCHGLTWLKSKG